LRDRNTTAIVFFYIRPGCCGLLSLPCLSGGCGARQTTGVPSYKESDGSTAVDKLRHGYMNFDLFCPGRTDWTDAAGTRFFGPQGFPISVALPPTSPRERGKGVGFALLINYRPHVVPQHAMQRCGLPRSVHISLAERGDQERRALSQSPLKNDTAYRGRKPLGGP
jgi:hypothetical protein